jgi:hypothetical protein
MNFGTKILKRFYVKKGVWPRYKQGFLTIPIFQRNDKNGSLLRIPDVYPGSEFFHPGSQVKKIPDPGSGSASKNLSIFNSKNCFLSPRNMIRDVHPGSGSRIRILTLYPSRILDPGSRTFRISHPHQRI